MKVYIDTEISPDVEMKQTEKRKKCTNRAAIDMNTHGYLKSIKDTTKLVRALNKLSKEKLESPAENIERALNKLSSGKVKPHTKFVRITDNTFVFSIGLLKDSVIWSASIRDYEKYEHACKQILSIFKVLNEEELLDYVSFAPCAMDGDKKIYYQFLYFEKDLKNVLYQAHNSNFENIDCFAKSKNKHGDLLLVFKYEHSGLRNYPERWLIESTVDNKWLRLQLKSKNVEESIILNFEVVVAMNDKEKVYVTRAGFLGHIHEDGFYGDPLAMIFTANTLEDTFNQLQHRLENRGFIIVDFDKFKQAVVEAEKKALKNE